MRQLEIVTVSADTGGVIDGRNRGWLPFVSKLGQHLVWVGSFLLLNNRASESQKKAERALSLWIELPRANWYFSELGAPRNSDSGFPRSPFKFTTLALDVLHILLWPNATRG